LKVQVSISFVKNKTTRMTMKHALKIFVWALWIIILSVITTGVQAQTWNPDHAIGTNTGNYSFSYNQTPDPLVEIYAPAFPNTGVTYQWESCGTPNGNFSVMQGATQSTFAFSKPLTQTTWYRRKTSRSAFDYIYSKVVKISVVSANWEDVNYLREHTVNISGQKDWKTVDQLAIGDKFQTTTYLDGLGRPVEQVSRETATPALDGGLWGDVVQFSQYDAMGRQSQKYLPYSTTSQAGKYKTAATTEQPQYYTNVYSETSAFSSLTFDNSPLNRVVNVKQSGSAWAAGAGNSVSYDVNTADDNVRIMSADYTPGDAPLITGVYAPGTLFKVTYTDENGKTIVEFTDNSGKLILKKVQLDDAPGNTYSGWICTYNVYDDFDRLRFTLQPEAVKWLDANGWNFAGTNGTQVLNELCFQYAYDERGRMIWKKSSGAEPLYMVYDNRNRQALVQDGNQRKQNTWLATLYDELDRPVITGFINYSGTVSDLQNTVSAQTQATTTVSTSTAPPSTIPADLVIATPNTAGDKQATNSITLDDNFTSADEFVAEIVDGGNTNAGSNRIVSYDPLPAGSTLDVLTENYYDDYAYPKAKAFNTGYTNTNAYNAGGDVMPIAQDSRTINMLTGTKTRVLGTTQYLFATYYYDKDGNRIQAQEDNIKGGADISTSQFNWDGRIFSVCNSHSAPGTGYSNLITLTKYNFDKIGRVKSLQKQYGSNAFKTIASYDYDDMGRVKTKHLDPEYNNLTTGGNELEALNYSYNIHSQLTGINKDYALKNAGYVKWGHYFGMYLGFDNKDGVFANRQLNGQVTGQLWSTMGDDAQRKYDYTYDNAGRLTSADFNEQAHPGDGWSKAKMDFSVNGNGGKITYDLNGNLLSMLQKGVVAGTPTPITVDDLHYTYASLSNKLQSVTDQMTMTNVNGGFGDFKDGANGSAPDYVYDDNGNLIIDLNKNVQGLPGAAANAGITYNYLDKPEQIKIAGKGTIKIVYDADGRKLQRTYTPETGTATTTTYINAFVYQSTTTGQMNWPTSILKRAAFV
jgi:hypothetical protein